MNDRIKLYPDAAGMNAAHHFGAADLASGGRPTPAAESRLSALMLFRLVLARKWLVASVTGVAIAGTYVVADSMTPIYRSGTTLLIETQKERVVSIDQIVAESVVDRDFFATQVEFLRSRGVLVHAIRDLGLVDHPQFQEAEPAKSATDEWLDAARSFIDSWFATATDFFEARILGRPAADPQQPIERSVPESAPTQVSDKLEDSVASHSAGQLQTGADEALKAVKAAEVARVMHGVNGVVTDREDDLVRRISRDLSIGQVWKSKLIEVSFDSPDPKLAALVANGIATAYIQADLDARFEVTAKASAWLNERLGELRDKLDAAEQNLQKLTEEAGLVRSRTAQEGSRQMLTASDRLVQARIARAQLWEVYRQVRPGADNRYSVPHVFNNPSVVQARAILNRAEIALQDAKTQLGEQHPAYIRARSEYETAQENLIAESEAVISSIEKEYQVARSTERAVEREIESAKSSIQDENRKELSIDTAVREVNSLRQVYQTFLARVKETSATADYQSPVARIVDEAVPAENPVRPKKLQLMIVAGFLGLLGGSSLALGLHRLSMRIRSSDDVEQWLRQPLLAAVPNERGAQEKNLMDRRGTWSRSLFGESIRTAVIGLQLSLLDSRTPIIGVTSTVMGEGKSTMAVTFAMELARRKRTLIIDADLRRPSIAKKLGLEQSGPGFSELLAGTAEPDACIRYLPDTNLHVITSGRLPRNPVDLLFSSSFGETLDALKEKYEVIIIDTPPLELVSDALVIGIKCSGVAYVVKSDGTEIPTIRRGLDRLAGASIRVLGVVLNGHDFKSASRYYGDTSAQGKYGYSYGPETSK